MKPQSKKLIRFLMDSSPMTAAVLADKMEVSIRSIKNYVHDINEECPSVIISSNEGYHIDRLKASALLENQQDLIPQTSEERCIYIISKLLNHNRYESVNVYDLCDEMYISLSTLKNELNKVKRRLHKYDLELVNKSDMISVDGLEKNKRKMLSTILYDESNINFINLESLQKTFVDIDIEFIKNTILEIFDKYHYFINDYSLINLVLHVTISIDRIRNGNFNNQDIDQLPGVKLHEFELAREVAFRLEEKFQIQYSKAEIYEMTLLIISRATTINYKSINADNLTEFIGADCLNLVNTLIQDINSFYYIDLSEQEFLIRFALHIRNLLVRSRNNYFSKNPLTEGIKTSCPLIYDMSVNLAQTIKEKTGISINDDEIAYIAFHLGSTLEAQKNLTAKITAVLYCPNYYDLNLRITDSINQYFSNDLLITNIITDESDLDKVENNDLIITTIPLLRISSTPVIQVSILINDTNRRMLSEKIEELRKTKKRNEFEKYLRELIVPEFFEHRNGIQNEKECIHYMVQKMTYLGYVDPSFEEEILEREQISTTAFGNFAIPHAMKMYAHKTGMNILISDEPILWKDHPVNLVLMMCFNRNERYIFNEIYDPITMILSEPENVKKILKSQNYEEFITTFINLL